MDEGSTGPAVQAADAGQRLAGQAREHPGVPGGGTPAGGCLAVPGEIIQRARSLGIHLDNWSMRQFTRKREGVLRSGRLAIEDTEMMLAALEQVRDQLTREFAQAQAAEHR